MKTVWIILLVLVAPTSRVILWMHLTSVSLVQGWIQHVTLPLSSSLRPQLGKRFRNGVAFSSSTGSTGSTGSRRRTDYAIPSTTLFGNKPEPDDKEDEDLPSKAEITKLPRLYVGQVQLKPVPVSKMSDLANAITSKTARLEVPPLTRNSMVYLSDDQAHYIISVLRMFRKSSATAKTTTKPDKTKKNSPQIRVFANGEEWLAKLFLMEHNVFTSKQIQRRTNMNPPDQPVALCRQQLGSLARQYWKQSQSSVPHIHCWLCIAPPKNKDRLRWMIEKTTELDCTGYIFIDTEYSEETSDDYQKKKFPKMQSYCVEAAEQCERLNLPHFITVVRELNPKGGNNITDEELKQELLDVPNVTKLSDLVHVWSEQPKNGVTLLICRERSNTISIWDALEQIYRYNQQVDMNDIITTLSSEFYTTKAVVFMIGPEGGWSPTEERMFNVLERDFPNHIYNVALSKTVLRTETAAMTAMSTFAIHRNHILINQQQDQNADDDTVTATTS